MTDAIRLYLDRGKDVETMPPLVAAQLCVVPDASGRPTVGILAVYDDGTEIRMAYANAEGALDLVLEPNDEIVLIRLEDGPTGTRTPAEDLVQALRTWLKVGFSSLDAEQRPYASMTIGEGALEVRTVDGDGTILTFDIDEDGEPLRAVWLQDAFLGLAWSKADIGPILDQHAADEIARINERLRIAGIRDRGEWRVVADECVRLGSTPSTTHKVGEPVKIGIQPIEPMPGDYNAEWLWVMLTKVEDDGAKLTGVFLNHPCVFAISAAHGDEVVFSNRDVYAGKPATEA